MSRSKHRNPFYWLLVAAGIAFTVTACAYSVMAVRQLRTTDYVTASQTAARQPQSGGNILAAGDSAAGEGLMEFLRQHGERLLIGELAVLGLATCAAIGCDQFWSRREIDASEQRR